MANKILLFNHKGGVSKTTSTMNIGWKLAELGKKVLLVDADPQCNLSAFFLNDNFDQYYDDENTKNNNLMAGVQPAFIGSPNPINALDCPVHPRNTNLFLLPGHMNLSELEAQLTFALTASMTLTGLQNLPGSFNDLIDKVVAKYSIDYVLMDVNPGLGPINQVLFLISDGFIIPTNPDLFCIMALNSLSRILPTWIHWKKQNIDAFADAAYPLPDTTTRFIGTLIQRFNIRNGVAAGPYKDLIQVIKDLTTNKFVPAIQNEGMIFEEDKYIFDNYCLCEIKDFASLCQKSQQYPVPVYALADDEIEQTGVVLQQQIIARNNFNQQFTDIANFIIQLYE